MKKKKRKPIIIDKPKQLADHSTQFLQQLEDAITEAEQETTDYLDDLGVDDFGDAAEYQYLKARAKVIKDYHSALTETRKIIVKKYRAELHFSGRRYPQLWMLKDSKIRAMMERYPLFVPLLNFLFDRNRRLKDKKYREMAGFNLRHIPGRCLSNRKYLGKYDYATFITDGDFYDEVTTIFDCSEITVKKFLKALCDIKALKKWKWGNNWIYSDGYFVLWGDKHVKHPFLTKSDYGKLRTFNPFKKPRKPIY